MGLDALPGIMTAIGTIFAIYGIMYIDKGGRERQQLNEYDIDCEAFQSGFNDITLRGGMSGLDLSKQNTSMQDLNLSHLSGR
jgi:hypothetical protein